MSRWDITGPQALAWSVAATAVPTAAGVWLLSGEPQGLIDLSEVLGAALLGVGLTVGPSAGYWVAGLERRASITSSLRGGALCLAASDRGSGWSVGAGAVVLVGASIWDFTHVAGDVDAHRAGWSLQWEPSPTGVVFSARARF